ncbi:MAG: hypothetical protein AB7O84_24700 [Planctomycetota bacterium]
MKEALGILLALGLALVLAGAAHGLAWCCLPRVGLVQRAAAAVAATLVVLTAAFHVTIALGCFARIPLAFIGVGAALIVLASWRRSTSWRRRVRCEVRALGRLLVLLQHSRWRGRASLFGVFAALHLTRTLVGVPTTNDAVVYHATRAAMWVQTSDLGAMRGPGQWEAYGLFPAGGEVLRAWAMLPLGNDLLVTLVDGIEWIALGLAVWSSCRQLGLREPAGTTAAAFVMAIPTVVYGLGACHVDVTLLLALFLAVALLLGVLHGGGPGALWLALATGGVATGVKFTGLVVMVPVFVLVCAWVSRGHRRRTLSAFLAGTVTAVALYAPWLCLSLARTGLPFSPVPLTFGGIRLGASHSVEWFLDRAALPEAATWDLEWLLASRLFGVPGFDVVPGALCLLPIALAPLGAVSLVRRQPMPACVLLVVVAAAAWAFWGAAFRPVRFHTGLACARFLLPFLAFCVPLSLCWGGPRVRARVAAGLWAAVVVHLVLLGLPLVGPFEVAAGLVLGGTAAAAVGLLRAWRRCRWPAARLAALAVLVLASAAWSRWRLQHRWAHVAAVDSFQRTGKYWLEGAAALDDPHRPQRIAITSGSKPPAILPAYHFTGRRLQNGIEYVSPLPDGAIPQVNPGDGWEQFASYEAWLHRLHARAIDAVASFDNRSIELEWMQSHPEDFEVVVANDQWGVYRVAGGKPHSAPR